MEQTPSKVTKVLWIAYLGLVAFSIFGSVAQKVLRIDAGAIAAVSSLSILLLATALIHFTVKSWPRLVAVAAIGGVAEFVGIFTGFPFGSYQYTAAWAPIVPLGPDKYFPIGVPLAWVLVACTIWLIVPKSKHPILQAILVGLGSMVFDVALEDVMVNGLGYWVWEPRGPIFGAPISNSLGWFGTAFLCSLAMGSPNSENAREDRLVGSRMLGAYCILMAVISGLNGLAATPLWITFAAALSWIAWRSNQGETK